MSEIKHYYLRQSTGVLLTDFEMAFELGHSNPKLREALADYESQRRVLERTLIFTPSYVNPDWNPFNHEGRFYKSTGPVKVRFKGEEKIMKIRTDRKSSEANFVTTSDICIFLLDESSRERECLFVLPPTGKIILEVLSRQQTPQHFREAPARIREKISGLKPITRQLQQLISS